MPAATYLGSSNWFGGNSHFLGCFYPGVPTKACQPSCSSLRATPSPPQGYRGFSTHKAAWSLLLPRDIEAFQRTMQPDLFMSLKRDLALVSYFSPFSNAKSIFPLSLSSSSSLNPLLFFCRSFSKFMWPRNGFKMLITSLKLSPNLSTRLRKLSGPWKRRKRS